MKLFYILLVTFLCIFSEKIQAQSRKNDSVACIFFIYTKSPNFQAISNYFYSLMDRKTIHDYLKNSITQYPDRSVTIIPNKPSGKFDPIIESIIERKYRLIDSVTITKSSRLVEEDFVLGGYRAGGKKYEQGDIKYRDEGDSTLIIRKYLHQYHPASESRR